jgi:hypothetical protein
LDSYLIKIIYRFRLNQPVSETSGRSCKDSTKKRLTLSSDSLNCKDFTKKRFAQSNDSLKCPKKKKEDLKREISLKYFPKKNSILKKESIIRLASLKSSMPAIQVKPNFYEVLLFKHTL